VQRNPTAPEAEIRIPIVPQKNLNDLVRPDLRSAVKCGEATAIECVDVGALFAKQIGHKRRLLVSSIVERCAVL
jgi:hypothetical protein